MQACFARARLFLAPSWLQKKKTQSRVCVCFFQQQRQAFRGVSVFLGFLGLKEEEEQEAKHHFFFFYSHVAVCSNSPTSRSEWAGVARSSLWHARAPYGPFVTVPRQPPASTSRRQPYDQSKNCRQLDFALLMTFSRDHRSLTFQIDLAHTHTHTHYNGRTDGHTRLQT